MTFPKLISLYVGSLLLSALIYSHFEHKSFFDGFYWSCVTSTTIGYGDLLPTTTETKTLAIVGSIFWVFFCIPSVVALILGSIIRDEHKFTHDEQELIKEALLKLCKERGITLHKGQCFEEALELSHTSKHS